MSNGDCSTLANRRKKRNEEKMFNGLVIDSVKSKSCIFDRNDDNFSDLEAIDAAWLAVAKECVPNHELTEEEAIQKVMKAWNLCLKAFSKERSRREQQPSSAAGGWPLFQKMLFIDKHMQKRPRSSVKSGQASKKPKVTDDSLKENQNTSNLDDDESVDLNDADDIQEQRTLAAKLERKEIMMRDMEMRAEREKALRLKRAELEAQEREAQSIEEQRKLEREAREQELAKQAKKVATEKKLIRSTADYVVAILDSIDNDDDRRELVKDLMIALYSR